MKGRKNHKNNKENNRDLFIRLADGIFVDNRKYIRKCLYFTFPVLSTVYFKEIERKESSIKKYRECRVV